MPRAFYHGLLILSSFPLATAAEIDLPLCDCDGDGVWSIDSIRNWQKFSAFVVLCGLTHLLNVFTYKPHSFLLVLALTISKFLTALVSFLTAITLLTLIPQLLKVKLRENFLRRKARELDREVGLMKRQEEASWHVRMLTQEIRKSLDKHTILYTTLVELSKTLQLQNCAVWMPNENELEMNLTHELNGRRGSSDLDAVSIPVDDPDVAHVKKRDGVEILDPESMLGRASSGMVGGSGAVAAIRMPMLKVSDFKRGTPEVLQACYGILVLVLPENDTRVWSHRELELIEVVADQVAVALSHAAVLEESHMIRDKLVEQNKVLLQARQNVMMASEAWNLFRKIMNQGIRSPIHSILGLLSIMQQGNLTPEQRLIVNTMAKTGGVVSALINDTLEINSEHFTLEMKPFQLQPLIKEAACIARCLCDGRGFGFGFQVENKLLDQVIGDERRILHVLLHIIGGLLNGSNGGCMTLRVWSDSELEDLRDQRWVWKSKFSNVNSCVKFEMAIRRSLCSNSSSSVQHDRKQNGEGFDTGFFSFGMCKKLVQLMRGNICIIPSCHGRPECVTLLLRLPLQPPMPISDLEGPLGRRHRSSSSLLEGLQVLLVDDDGINRKVTHKLLEKLGCCVSPLSTGAECLSSIGTSGAQFQLVILDLNMPMMNGYEVATKVRDMRTGCRPLIVALTASTEEHVWERCVKSGMNGLIRKPVLLPELERELLRALTT
ncbi:Ethylene receptor [Musa troglodytarum]|uniref:histidine kinase n=1 Tax=Musa troglodytarum TaxID=320322 RepID=A0A9E7FEX2_9LILI|nr:Ethylene receptor [Musa troglodytarum]